MQRQNIFTGIKILPHKNLLANANRESINKAQEQQKNNDELISIKENTVIIRNRQSFKLFKLDNCLDKHSGQQQIYDNFCLNMVEDFINGYDCTLILCGQNNRFNPLTDIVLGKETEQTKGIIPRMIQQLNNSIKYFSQNKFLIKVSFLQICEQEMIDLLAVKKCKLEIKQQKLNKTEFYVHNLQTKPIQKVDEIESFYLLGNRKRQYAYSKDIRKKKNSTTFFTVYLESVEENGTIYRKSKFTICELAQNMFEDAGNFVNNGKSLIKEENKFLELNYNSKLINLSNSAFQNVINTLVYGDEQTTVPYRDSKVTKLLRPALGGTHKTSICGTIDPSNQNSLPKIFKILKTLQLSSQIQNSPTNIKLIDDQTLQNSNFNIVSLLKNIQALSNQLQTTKASLQGLINNPNYINQEIQKIQQKNGHSLIKDNEFCSQENIHNKVIEQKTKKQWELKKQIKDLQKELKQKISYIQNLSNQDKDHQNDEQQFAKEQFVIRKRKQILLRIRNIKEKRLKSLPNQEMQHAQRQKKRQLFALEIQFQKQRNLYMSTIRQLQENLSLYKKIAQHSLKTEEIQIIKTNSKYDETKRQFDIPLFMIKDKKVRSGNIASPLLSERKFLVSPRSSSFNSLHSNKSSHKKTRPFDAKNTINDGLKNILARKPLKNSEYNAEYQIENDISKDSKNGNKKNKNSRSKQLITMISRKKSPSDSITKNTMKNTLMIKLNNKQHIQKVVSEYEISEIDMDKVAKYNEERKKIKSKQKDFNSFSSNNLMKRQKLNTQPPIGVDERLGKYEVLSPEKNYLPKSPRQNMKRWM